MLDAFETLRFLDSKHVITPGRVLVTNFHHTPKLPAPKLVDFENLLRRLNAANGDEPEEAPMKIDGFTKGASMTTVDAEKDTVSSGDEHVGAEPKEEKRSKKKRRKDEDGEEGERRKKKHKKSKTSEDRSESDGGSKKEKKSKKRDSEGVVSPPLEAETSTAPSPVPASRSTSAVPSRQ